MNFYVRHVIKKITRKKCLGGNSTFYQEGGWVLMCY